MIEMLPTSKSSYKEIRTCPYHWYATHILGLREKPGKPALIGLDVEHIWTRVIRDGLDMETAMSQLQYDESPELLMNALSITEVGDDPGFQIDIYLDESGYQVLDDRKEDAILRCILDYGLKRPTETLIADLKCGQRYVDWNEINFYVAAGRAWNPFVDRVRFQYLWARDAKIEEYVFDFDGSQDVTVTLPNGDKQIHRDWWPNIATNILSLQDVEPEPKPGDHCGSWYGKPCHVLGSCPAHKQTEGMIVESAPVPMTNTTAILLRALANGEHVELGPLMASEALGAVLHAEAYLDKIKSRIQEWSRQNGPVKVGEYEFSYQPRESIDVDTAQALKVMFESGMHFSEMAKAINISKSSIGKLPKGFGEIKDYIMAYCTSNNMKVTESWTKRKAG